MKKTTIKFRLWTSSILPDSGKLVLCVTRHRITRSSTLPCKLSPEEWDEESQRIIIPKDIPHAQKERLSAIVLQLQKAQRDVWDVARILEEQGDDFTASDVIDCFHRRQQHILVCAYISEIVKTLKSKGKIGTAHAYECAYKSFLRFLKGKDICLEEVTSPLIRNYQQFLLDSKHMKNTVSCYMRSLRAAYNLIVREKFIEEKKRTPFSSVFTGNAPSTKRAVKETEI